jgi:hypothetical protein
MSFSVPASRNGLPMPVAGKAPSGVIGTVLSPARAPAYLTAIPGHLQQIAGSHVPVPATLTINQGAVPPVRSITLHGVSDIRPISVTRRLGVSPGGNQPGTTGQPAGTPGNTQGQAPTKSGGSAFLPGGSRKGITF